ncbi:hypothetical protein [uncultured Fibrella sp.]|uniref:hypothetical protein n=1 Tax=uncultured Fibrella sp. TaxID=1284596 RepID=UPI0035CA3078
MSSLRRVGLSLVVVGGLWSCQEKAPDTPTPLPDPGLSWQASDAFLYGNKIQLNSYADSSRIILAGSQTTSIAPGESRPGTDTTFVHYSGQAQPYGNTYQRPAIGSQLLAFANTSTVNLVSVASPVANYSNAVVRMKDVDPDFADFNLVPYSVGDCMAINQQQQVLIPYSNYDRSYQTPVIDGNTLHLALVSTVIAPTSGYVSVRSVLPIHIPNTGQVSNLVAQGNYLFVATYGGGGAYRIAPNGSYQQTYPYSILRFFVGNGTLYGLTYANTQSLKLIASTDQGVSWKVLTDQLPADYQSLQIRQVNNQLIAWYNSQLFQLTITPTKLTAVELDNTGLYGNQITSVATFRNTVYVSTLSGVFTKPVRTFLTPKKV